MVAYVRYLINRGEGGGGVKINRGCQSSLLNLMVGGQNIKISVNISKSVMNEKRDINV